MSDLTKLESEFIKFCKSSCPMGCDTMKLKHNENRYDAILESCPILMFDKYIACKNNIEVDFVQLAKKITSHNLWGKLQ